jgi:hypothetical protein
MYSEDIFLHLGSQYSTGAMQSFGHVHTSIDTGVYLAIKGPIEDSSEIFMQSSICRLIPMRRRPATLPFSFHKRSYTRLFIGRKTFPAILIIDKFATAFGF